MLLLSSNTYLPCVYLPYQLLLHNDNDNDRPEPPALLLTLCPEVLFHIYSSIAHSPSQISFALTCKQLSRLASRIDLSLSLASPRYAGFLPVSVFDVPDLMNHLKPWMPSHLRLCGHCLTYRPFLADYWHNVPGHERNDFWVCFPPSQPVIFTPSLNPINLTQPKPHRSKKLAGSSKTPAGASKPTTSAQHATTPAP
jgi:hypothetical protein